MTEQETVRQSVQERQPHQQQVAPPTVSWPPSGVTPINEFNTEGYISCAFPTLFPTGAADFVAPRPLAVTVGNYFKHLLMYADGRFARHPRFRYFALNTEMRWRALQAGRIYVHQHPHDAQLSVEELRDMVGHEGEVFSNRVLHYAVTHCMLFRFSTHSQYRIVICKNCTCPYTSKVAIGPEHIIPKTYSLALSPVCTLSCTLCELKVTVHFWARNIRSGSPPNALHSSSNIQTGFGRSTALFSSARSTLASRISP